MTCWDMTRDVLFSAMLAAATLIAPHAARAAESPAITTPRVTATLLSARDAVTPGERFQVALVQKIAPGWHTYWINPGDSGEPTRIEWNLSNGASAGDIQWPTPKAITVDPLVNFGFEETVFLIVDVIAPHNAAPGEKLSLKANATWLVCEKICVPEEGRFALDVAIGAMSIEDSAAQQRISAARAAQPAPAPFKAKLTADGEMLALALPGIAETVSDLRFFPVSETLIEHAAPQPKKASVDGPLLQLTRSPHSR